MAENDENMSLAALSLKLQEMCIQADIGVLGIVVFTENEAEYRSSLPRPLLKMLIYEAAEVL